MLVNLFKQSIFKKVLCVYVLIMDLFWVKNVGLL